MKRRLALLLCALLLLCGGCASARPLRTGYLFAMDTFMEFRVYGTAEQVSDVSALISDLEHRLSVTDPDSEIAALSRDGTAELSTEAAALLEEALALCASTDGALDSSGYPVLRAWGFTGEEYRVPDPAELEELTASVDWARVRLEGGRVSLGPGQEIDLGSVAKGYAGRLAAERLRQGDVRSALLNLGGNIQTVGTKPDGTPWRVAVRDPFGEGNLGVIDAADCAVVTSGGYERCFEENGEIYWHIMDPDTGYPAKSGLVSVTVVGADGLLCDALSTALFVMGPDRAAAYWRTHGGFDAVLVTENGEILITAGLRDRFVPLENYADAEVTVIERA